MRSSDCGLDPVARAGRIKLRLTVALVGFCLRLWIALISAGADINTQTELGITALMYASFYNTNPRVIDALLDAGANATLEDEDGNTAPELARSNGALTDTPTLTRLIEAGN